MGEERYQLRSTDEKAYSPNCQRSRVHIRQQAREHSTLGRKTRLRKKSKNIVAHCLM